MAGEKPNKIIYAGNVLLDLTSDTVEVGTLLYGATAHDASGEIIVGECTYDADTSDATASASEILDTKTAYKAGAKVIGNMPNRGGVSGTISTKAGQYTIQQGYHDGSGKVAIDAIEQSKIIAGNIKKDIVILGIRGEYEGAGATAESKTVTPDKNGFTVLPTSADYLSQVVVNPIPYTETVNAQGGLTITIG